MVCNKTRARGGHHLDNLAAKNKRTIITPGPGALGHLPWQRALGVPTVLDSGPCYCCHLHVIVTLWTINMRDLYPPCHRPGTGIWAIHSCSIPSRLKGDFV